MFEQREQKALETMNTFFRVKNYTSTLKVEYESDLPNITIAV